MPVMSLFVRKRAVVKMFIIYIIIFHILFLVHMTKNHAGLHHASHRV